MTSGRSHITDGGGPGAFLDALAVLVRHAEAQDYRLTVEFLEAAEKSAKIEMELQRKDFTL